LFGHRYHLVHLGVGVEIRQFATTDGRDGGLGLEALEIGDVDHGIGRFIGGVDHIQAQLVAIFTDLGRKVKRLFVAADSLDHGGFPGLHDHFIHMG